jgi:zinc transport system substrate-binding protein
MRNFSSAIFLTVILILLPFFSNAEAPKITVSIKPIHSLVASVTDGITSPTLLLDKNNSPHTYTLKPSDVKKLKDSDIIFLVSYDLEIFLQKPLKNLNKDTKIVELIKANGLNLLPQRDMSLTANHDYDDHGANDPHIWLSPDNAIRMTEYIAQVLSEKDLANSEKYKQNAAELIKNITLQKELISEELAPYKSNPYIVFHDGYQYFDKYYGLNFAGAITVPSHEGLSAKRLKEIEKITDEKNVKCLFAEPQFSPSVVEAISQNKKISVGSLDYMGTKIDAGKNAYLDILNNLADNMVSCFKN